MTWRIEKAAAQGHTILGERGRVAGVFPHPSRRVGAQVTTLAEGEKALIEAALAECHGRVSGPGGAAARLGIPRQTLESKIKALRIDKLSSQRR
jgi:transcriptional regulator of acetoin/glycerol metabolism